MNKGVWKEAVREDAYKKVVGSCDRCKGGICAEEGEGVPIIKGRKRGSKRVCEGATEERVHPAVKITTNGAGVLRGEEGWKKENGTRLSLS